MAAHHRVEAIAFHLQVVAMVAAIVAASSISSRISSVFLSDDVAA